MSLANACGITCGVALAVVGYAYVGYPMLLLLLSALRRSHRARSPGVQEPPVEWPMVSITIPVYNEAATIRGKLERLTSLDYPPERRQILVVSDASSDRTDEIVREFADRGVELLRLQQRVGKTAAENAARSLLRGGLVVNTDASVSIAAGALKPLVAAFTDGSVGVASGRDMSVASGGSRANEGESRYVGYEMWLRDLETRVEGIVGASGCFYAVRKHVHTFLVPAALSRDFAAPLIAREHGYRAVSVREAVCYVPRTASLRREYARKVRTITRGIETLLYKRHLLNPFRYGLFAWMLISHKLCRWFVPWALVLAGCALAVLSVFRPWARWVLGAAALAALVAALGWLWPERWRPPKIVRVLAYAFAAHIAVLHASLRAVRQELDPIWEPTRREPVGIP
jgi:cellulose synthase/poly-beta-1,6-N-acetylglucosamine synthase-like glycosyltransferase